MSEQGPYFHRDAGAPPNSPVLLVFIEEKAVKNERMSGAGAAVYDSVVLLRVVAPGQKNGSPIYEVKRTQSDGSVKYDERVRERFREVFAQWEKKQLPSSSGTPLEQWPLLDVALVRAFKDANVYTVQQLAEMQDGFLDAMRVPKAREWRSKAYAWLQQAREAVDVVELAARVAAMEEQLKERDETIQQLLSQQNAEPNEGAMDKPRRRRKGETLSLPEAAEENSRL